MVMTEVEAAASASATAGGGPSPFTGGLVVVEPVLLPVDRDVTMMHALSERAVKRKAVW